MKKEKYTTTFKPNPVANCPHCGNKMSDLFIKSHEYSAAVHDNYYYVCYHCFPGATSPSSTRKKHPDGKPMVILVEFSEEENG